MPIAETETPTDTLPARGLRFVIIGGGSIGRRHLGNLQTLGATENVVIDVDDERRRAGESQFGVQTEAALEAAWRTTFDAALVTVPTSAHVPIALAAAEQGCHLFIEKPLADKMDGVDKLASVVDHQRLITLIGCNLRFHPGLMAVKQLVADGVIGRVLSARAEFGYFLPDWHPWEDYRETYSARRDHGGGVILDAIHEVDYLRWLVGEMTSIACIADTISTLEIDTEDVAAMLLRFAGGAVGEIHLDYLQRRYSRSCQIVGERGTVRWDYVTGRVTCACAPPGETTDIPLPAGWEPNQMYADEMRHFIGCLRGSESPSLDLDGGRRVLEIALAAKASAATGRFIDLVGRETW